jgi:ParB family chromosome partitioning protein
VAAPKKTKAKSDTNAQTASAKKTTRRKKPTLEVTGLEPKELLIESPPQEIAALSASIESDGGAVLAAYREPLGGKAIILAALPIDKVGPTPFQRDVSDAHVKKLTFAMDKTRRFLDPIIAVREPDGTYHTPNGNHRLNAVKGLGGKSIIALVVPEKRVAFQILALNIEKAHNLRERALEVARMYEDLSKLGNATEETYALEIEEPSLATLGFAYLERPRLSGGAYSSPLKKVDAWIEAPIEEARVERQRRAKVVLELDDAVSETVAKLKERGLTSPYLKAFVVARVNPLRFIKGEPPSFDELMATMTKRARGMKVDGVKVEDLAKQGGAPEEE